MLTITAVLAILSCMALPMSAQEVTTRSTVTGTVVSYSKNTLTIKSGDGHYRLFLLNHDTVRPKDLTTGSGVRVTATPTDDPAVRLANHGRRSAGRDACDARAGTDRRCT